MMHSFCAVSILLILNFSVVKSYETNETEHENNTNIAVSTTR